MRCANVRHYQKPSSRTDGQDNEAGNIPERVWAEQAGITEGFDYDRREWCEGARDQAHRQHTFKNWRGT